MEDRLRSVPLPSLGAFAGAVPGASGLFVRYREAGGTSTESRLKFLWLRGIIECLPAPRTCGES